MLMSRHHPRLPKASIIGRFRASETEASPNVAIFDPSDEITLITRVLDMNEFIILKRESSPSLLLFIDCIDGTSCRNFPVRI